MLTWKCSTLAQSSGWLDPLHIHTATPDVSWPCPLSQRPSPSQSLHLRQWCYRQCAWWISWEQKQVNINKVLPSAKQMAPKRTQVLSLTSCDLNLKLNCYMNKLWMVQYICLRKGHCPFTSFNKTTRATVSYLSQWKLNSKGSPNQTSLQNYFCVIKCLMDVSFLPADICSSSSS